MTSSALLQRRGEHLLDQHLLEASAEELHQALAVAEEAREVSRAQNLLTLVRLEQGRFADGLAAAEEAVAAAATGGRDVHLSLVSHLNHLVALAEAGRLWEAHAASLELETLLLGQGGEARALLPHFYQTAANISYELGRLHEAEVRANAAHALLAQADQPHLFGLTKLTLAAIDIELGRPDTALWHLDGAAALVAAHASPQELAHIETERARAHLALGHAGEGLREATRAAELLLRDPAFVDWLELGRVCLLLGAILERAKEPTLALGLQDKGHSWLQARGRRTPALRLRRDLAADLLREEDFERLRGTISFLEWLLREGTAVGHRLADHAYFALPAFAAPLDRTLLEHAAFQAAAADAPPPPLPAPQLEALASVQSFLAQPQAAGSPREARVLAVLHPYTRTTVEDGSYVDALNDLLRRSRLDLDLDLVDAFLEQHLLPDERWVPT